MTEEIDRSLTRLEASTQVRKLARNIQLANGAMLAYVAGLANSEDHTLNEEASLAIGVCAKIAGKAHMLQDIAIKLETADKDEARQRDEDEFMSKLLRTRLGGEE